MFPHFPIPYASTSGIHESVFWTYDLNFFKCMYIFLDFHIQESSCGICFSQSGLFHMAECPGGPFMLLQMASCHSLSVAEEHSIVYIFIPQFLSFPCMVGSSYLLVFLPNIVFSLRPSPDHII